MMLKQQTHPIQINTSFLKCLFIPFITMTLIACGVPDRRDRKGGQLGDNCQTARECVSGNCGYKGNRSICLPNPNAAQVGEACQKDQDCQSTICRSQDGEKKCQAQSNNGGNPILGPKNPPNNKPGQPSNPGNSAGTICNANNVKQMQKCGDTCSDSDKPLAECMDTCSRQLVGKVCWDCIVAGRQCIRQTCPDNPTDPTCCVQERARCFGSKP